MYKIIIFLYFIANVYSYLTVPQWNTINKLIKNKETPVLLRNKINNIIFMNYYNKTRYESYMFKVKYNLIKTRYCREIDDYAYIGLFKAIQKYDGRGYFYNYAKNIIYFELIKSFSELLNVNILPHYLKHNKKIIIDKEKYKINYNKNFVFEKKEQDILFYKEDIIEKVNHLDIKLQIIFYYKYGIHLDQKVSNKVIAEMLNCSEESIRLKIKKIIKLLSSI
jgi:hypothetical protein